MFCIFFRYFQIIAQFPHSFEFGEEFLIFLFEHAYASEFGSFLGNNEMMKAQLGIKKSTISLWSYVNNPEILRSFVNVLYEPRESVIWPSVAPQSIVCVYVSFENMYGKDFSSDGRAIGQRKIISRSRQLSGEQRNAN
ncbi:hypothetical protein OESDEN_00212 [Oesophagostomum dentatum]|uniref:Myotubularin phosphatase domain-containing protein n=1 Tax=Oesophagostomum dentatum TaxID=61180 RepID=A0A0B1TUJ4_OESDE|nr:hypothetical protein OESDEN_00212 [Oesophagostomum dentatum]